MRTVELKRVPAHMRHLQGSIIGRNCLDIACDPAEAICLAVFKAAIGHELHANADAKERLGGRDVFA